MHTRPLLLAFLLLSSSLSYPQTPTATINGRVLDPSRAVISGADVNAINQATNVGHSTQTNESGLFTIVDLQPGIYRLEVSKIGFRTILKPDVILHVQDVVAMNFDMSIGSTTETVTVQSGSPMVDSQDASVSTVIDRNFADKLPLNGRSFQTLIQLTPGVALTVNNGTDTGQFSINGQRATSNYWMVDGVSANIGINSLPTAGNGLGGTLGSTSVLGGTNSLVSVDALQEFRIQTSTYAPEFGRTPGGQISIVTRSGTNRIHGGAFDYLRNDALDANDWFANRKGLPKPRERQNDFGGTLSGPLIKDRTFFFFSYEGLRLRLPQTALTNVPDLGTRQTATSTMQPYLNAYPLPNGPDNPATGIAQFNSTFSNPGALDAYSLRLDHKLTDHFRIFGRHNYSPTELDQRGLSSALSVVSPVKVTTQTSTAGATWNLSPLMVDDIRVNYSTTDASSAYYLDHFGGAQPLAAPPFPSSVSAQNSRFVFVILSLGATAGQTLLDGKNGHNKQRQFNIVDNLSMQERSHSIKLGFDFRRLAPRADSFEYQQQPVFAGVSQAKTGTPILTALSSTIPTTFLFKNLSAFAQDTWSVIPRLTITYGLRWDVDFAPSTLMGPNFAAITGFRTDDLSALSLAPAGTPAFNTRYDNVAPRFGIAYELHSKPEWETVVRGGFGVFFDLSSAEAGNLASGAYPFSGTFIRSGSFPLAVADPPQIVPPGPGSSSTLTAFDPNLESPYSLEFNVAVEQALGKQQSLTASYVGSLGRRLMQTASISKPNANYAGAKVVTDTAESSYNALQLQFRRRLSAALQALASYSWAHSIDSASASSNGSGANNLAVALGSSANRGPSDFDIRNSFSLGLTYDIPHPKVDRILSAMLRDWSVENALQARSAPPLNVFYSSFSTLSNGFFTQVRPNLDPSQPVYLYGDYPGGKALNAKAFIAPPVDATTRLPTAQGTLARNALRGFGMAQWDLAIHRTLPLRESLKLQVRAEMFNVFNHPNFGQPIGNLGSPAALNSQFGQSTQMLNQGLSGAFGVGSGGFNPLYQVGGPRSIQVALKLQF